MQTSSGTTGTSPATSQTVASTTTTAEVARRGTRARAASTRPTGTAAWAAAPSVEIPVLPAGGRSATHTSTLQALATGVELAPGEWDRRWKSLTSCGYEC